MQKKNRLLIDTDPGIDDALAIIFALNSPEISVEAITTVAGNVSIEKTTLNLLRILDLIKPMTMPIIAAGAPRPLKRAYRPNLTPCHGSDGLGDVKGWPDLFIDKVKHNATDVIVESAKKYGGELVLVTIGPLTNIAHAISADMKNLSQINRLVIMGGAVDIPGNITETAEFNMHIDPEAAKSVFDSELPIYLVPFNVTQRAVVTAKQLDEQLAKSSSQIASRIHQFTRHSFTNCPGDNTMLLHDPLAVGLAAFPELAQWKPTAIAIGANGEARTSRRKSNCLMATDVLIDQFITMFLNRLEAQSSQEAIELLAQ